MKKKATGYNYGECEICNTPLQEKLIKQDFLIRDELIIVEDIPAGVCPQCGEKIVKAKVARWVTELIKILTGLPKRQESLLGAAY